MKLRNRAVPGDPRDKSGAPADQRLHIKARSGIGEGIEEKVCWFRKSTSVGRTLDLLAAQLKIYVSPLQLIKVSGDVPVKLPTDRSLNEVIEDGDEVLIMRTEL